MQERDARRHGLRPHQGSEAAQNLGVDDVAAEGIDIDLHQAPLRIERLDAVFVVLAFELGEVAIAHGFHQVLALQAQFRHSA